MGIETLIFGAAEAPRPNCRVAKGADMRGESGGFETHIRIFFSFLLVCFPCNPRVFLEDTFFVLSCRLLTFPNGSCIPNVLPTNLLCHFWDVFRSFFLSRTRDLPPQPCGGYDTRGDIRFDTKHELDIFCMLLVCVEVHRGCGS